MEERETNLVVIIVRKTRPQRISDKNTGLKSPSPCNIAHGIAATAENHRRQVKALHKVDTVCVAPHAQVEAP